MIGDLFGEKIVLVVSGESHGKAIIATLCNVPAGIKIDEETISTCLSKRMGLSTISTKRREKENYEILSGVYNGFSTGTPITIIIPNADTKSKDYESLYGIARPGHCDYTNHIKYKGFEDFRGGGHSSGRITAGIVAAGGLIIPALKRKGIDICCHIKSVGNISDRDFEDFKKDFELIKSKDIAILDDKAAENIVKEIKDASSSNDSLGGITECLVTGLPAGIGEPLFDSIESSISQIIFSIPAVKGIEFGDGFALAIMHGSNANDSFVIENDSIKTKTNHNGGINGGISNGMPIVFRVAVKPTPSISKKQTTVDFINMKETDISIKGRHDPCIVTRIPVIIECATAIALADLLTSEYGEEWLST